MINLLSLLLLMEPSVVVIGERPSTRNEDLSPFVTEIEGDAEAVGDLGALLEGAIGARVRREGGVGGRQTLQLRGGGAHQVGIFLDDIPLQPARGGAFDLARLPAAWVERGRLIRGPSAARWGGGAQGGVLQLESRESPDHLALKLGSFGLTQLDGGARWGQAALIGHLSHAQGDFPFKDTNGALRRREGNAHLSGGGLMRGQLGGARLLLSLSGYQRGEPGPEQFPRSARAEGASVQLGLSARPKQSLRGYAYAQGQINRYVDPQPPAVDPQGRFQLQEGGLGGGLRFEAGAGWALEGTTRLEHAAVDSDTRPARADARLGGALALAQRRWLWPWLGISGRLRADALTGRDPLFIPQVGLALQPHRRFSARANLGRVFRDPSFDELYFEGVGVRGNPRLRAEDGWGADLGLIYQQRAFELELVGFAQRYSRLILFVPKSAYLVEATDEDGARIDGVEGRLRLGRRPARLEISYARLDHAFDHAPRAPLPHRATQQLYARGELLSGPGVLYGIYDWRDAVTLDRGGARRLPAYGLVTLGASGWIAPAWRVGLEIRNLLDAQAIDQLQAPRPGRAFFTFFLWRP